MTMIFLLLIFTVSISVALNSDHPKICELCDCTSKNNSYTTDCSNRDLTHFPEYNLENHHLILILNNNILKTINTVPSLKGSIIDISLVNCSLEELGYGAFVNAVNIHHLDLGFNKLTGDAVRGDIFRGPFDINEYEPINLEVLNLEHNLIHSLDRKMFDHLPKLRVLYLNNNPLEMIDAVTDLALYTVKNLEVLDLSHTGISSLPRGMFRSMKKLKQLFLNGNKLTTVPESIGALGGSLKYLTINENLIKELDDNSFLGLWRVEFLEISGMKTLTMVKAATFIQLRSLQILHICNNENLENIDENAFRELKDNWPIQELYLNNNNLRSISGNLAPWDQLQSVNLDNNPWDCDCSLGLNLKSIKLSLSSTAKCMSPMEVSGYELSKITPNHVCTEDMLDESKGNNTYEFRKKYHFVYYTRPGNVLIIFSIAVIVTFIGVIIGVRMKTFRERLARMNIGPIRYRHVNS